MQFIDQIDINEKRILIRIECNVPLKDGLILDDLRLKTSLETISYALSKNAKIILCGHLGRPKGKFNQDYSLLPVAKSLTKLLNVPVILAPDCIGEKTYEMSLNLKQGEILLLENVRFHQEEIDNDPNFSRELAKMGDIYVNDAFGVAHRAQSSVVGVTKFMDVCCGGFLLKKEMQYLQTLISGIKHPYVALIGGSKISTKLHILQNLLTKVDSLLIAGAMANTFLKAKGYEVGKSLVEDDYLDLALKILEQAKKNKVKLYLPVDMLVGKSINGTIGSGVCTYQDIPKDEMILDCGPATHVLFSEVLKNAALVLWNGPLGVFENTAFAQGSINICRTVAALSAITIVGGGETAAVVAKAKLENKISFISTGGGSFFEFMSGATLPALKALEDKDN